MSLRNRSPGTPGSGPAGVPARVRDVLQRHYETWARRYVEMRVDALDADS